MKEYKAGEIRNVAVVGHGASGKTTLVDALAFVSGSSKRRGNIKDGTALTDHAELPGSVAVAPALCHLAAVGAVDRLDRELLPDRPHDLGRGHDVVQPPAVRRADVHVLDEPEHVGRAHEVARHLEDRALLTPR